MTSMYLARSNPSHNPFLICYVDLQFINIINKPIYTKRASGFEDYFDRILTSDQKSFLWRPKDPLVKFDHNYCTHVAQVERL